MSFTIFQNEITPFQTIKTRRSKRRKIDIFPKAIAHGFAPNKAIYPTFFFQANFRKFFPQFCSKNGDFLTFFFQVIQARKMPFTIFQNKKMPFQALKGRNSKSHKKLTLFQKGVKPWFWYKNGHFSNFYFQAKKCTKMSFKIFQNE